MLTQKEKSLKKCKISVCGSHVISLICSDDFRQVSHLPSSPLCEPTETPFSLFLQLCHSPLLGFTDFCCETYPSLFHSLPKH